MSAGRTNAAVSGGGGTPETVTVVNKTGLVGLSVWYVDEAGLTYTSTASVAEETFVVQKNSIVAALYEGIKFPDENYHFAFVDVNGYLAIGTAGVYSGRDSTEIVYVNQDLQIVLI